jgi:hypothetical protein
VPTCTYAAAPDLTHATNYQDLWWGGASQDGWGINLTHEGNVIYATWYTYDTDGSPVWFASLMNASGPGLYTGPLIRARGPAFGSAFDPAAVSLSTVGTASLVIVNGNIAVWNYSIGTLSSAKSLTRFLFAAPAATVCH